MAGQCFKKSIGQGRRWSQAEPKHNFSHVNYKFSIVVLNMLAKTVNILSIGIWRRTLNDQKISQTFSGMGEGIEPGLIDK